MLLLTCLGLALVQATEARIYSLSSMDLNTFSMTSEPEIKPFVSFFLFTFVLFASLHAELIMTVKVSNFYSQKSLPSGNSMNSKYCALGINSIWNLYFAAYICSQPNKISVFCFFCKDKMLQDQVGMDVLYTPSTFQHFPALSTILHLFPVLSSTFQHF